MVMTSFFFKILLVCLPTMYSRTVHTYFVRSWLSCAATIGCLVFERMLARACLAVTLRSVAILSPSVASHSASGRTSRKAGRSAGVFSALYGWYRD